MNIQSWKIMSFLVLASIMMIGGCPQTGKEKEKEKGNQPPQLNSQYITPPSARPGDKMRAGANLLDKEADECNIEYEWYLNGEILEDEKGEFFDTEGLFSGDKIFAKLRPVEKELGKAGDWVKTKEVTLGDFKGLKLKGVSIEPSPLNIVEPAKAIIDYGDMDKYSVDEVYYRWFSGENILNGEESDTLNMDNSFKNSYLTVQICTNGLFEPGTTTTSKSVLVNNVLPKFVGDPKPIYQGNYIVYEFKVYDPDDDYLEFSLLEGPINSFLSDSTSGKVMIPLANTKPGRYTLSLKVSDESGGSALGKKVITISDQ